MAEDVKNQTIDAVQLAAGPDHPCPPACPGVVERTDRRIETLATSALTPYKRNLRSHALKQIRQIAVIAAAQTGRRARVIEIDPLYVDKVVRGWQKYTGKAATLRATGQSFEEIQERRAGASSVASAPSVETV